MGSIGQHNRAKRSELNRNEKTASKARDQKRTKKRALAKNAYMNATQ
jgi:hypothetical protein